MNYTRKLIILAKSKKFGGYCIAGKINDNHQWIRPVKEEPFSLNETKNFLDSNRSVEIFDIVKMTFKEKCPEIHQPENEKVDMDEKWVYISKFQIENLYGLIDYGNGDILNIIKKKCVSERELKKLNLNSSLQLIKLSNSNQVKLYYKKAFRESYYKPRLKFEYKEKNYDFAITDPEYSFLNNPVTRDIDDAYITIGLGKINLTYYIFIVMLEAT